MPKEKHFEGEKINITAGIEITAIPEMTVFDSSEKGLSIIKSLGDEAKAKAQGGLEYGEVEVIVSNSGTDRHGESITMEGIDLKEIKRNPVVLWAHEYSALPIGKITKLWKKEGNLMARIKLDYDIYDFADTVYKMILRGTINAVSIGGMVRKWSDDYLTVEKLEMVELSVVPVGAHPDALVTAKSLGMEVNTFRKEYEDFVRDVLVDKIKVLPQDSIKLHINSLKTLISALESTYTEASADSDETPKTQKVKRIIKLAEARKAAIQVDKQAELIVAAIKIKLNE
jgi:uncharacterized protein